VNESNSRVSDAGDGGSHDAQGFDSQMMSGTPQTMEDLVAQAMPGSPGFQRLNVRQQFWSTSTGTGLPSYSFV